jgi:hypothetical protein
MPLKDILKKKEKIKDEGATQSSPKGPMLSPDVPEFTFMRTTTTTQEIFEPPTFPGDPTRQREQPLLSPKRVSRFRRHSNAGSTTSDQDKGESRLSERLHFGRARSSSSANVPDNLPDVGEGVARNEDDEARWEKRATMLAQGNIMAKSGSTTPNIEIQDTTTGSRPRSRARSVSDAGGDVCPYTVKGAGT